MHPTFAGWREWREGEVEKQFVGAKELLGMRALHSVLACIRDLRQLLRKHVCSKGHGGNVRGKEEGGSIGPCRCGRSRIGA